jgi:hypothetical protein
MSDPLAVSILAKLTSWYPFDGDALDAHGPNDIDEVVSIAYEPGLKGQQAAAGSYGNATLATPIAVTATSGQMTIGGWFEYDSAAGNNIPAFGFAWGPFVGNEAFKIIVESDGYFYSGIWGDAGINGYNAIDPLSGAVNYPITVEADDANGRTASSNQLIRIVSGGPMQPGRYFVVATWNNGVQTLYMDGHAVDVEPAPAGPFERTSITWAGIGRSYSSNLGTIVGCDECFFSDDSVMSAEEIFWLFNSGAGRSYAEVVAATV